MDLSGVLLRPVFQERFLPGAQQLGTRRVQSVVIADGDLGIGFPDLPVAGLPLAVFEHGEADAAPLEAAEVNPDAALRRGRVRRVGQVPGLGPLHGVDPRHRLSVAAHRIAAAVAAPGQVDPGRTLGPAGAPDVALEHVVVVGDDHAGPVAQQISIDPAKQRVLPQVVQCRAVQRFVLGVELAEKLVDLVPRVDQQVRVPLGHCRHQRRIGKRVAPVAGHHRDLHRLGGRRTQCPVEGVSPTPPIHRHPVTPGTVHRHFLDAEGGTARQRLDLRFRQGLPAVGLVRLPPASRFRIVPLQQQLHGACRLGVDGHDQRRELQDVADVGVLRPADGAEGPLLVGLELRAACRKRTEAPPRHARVGPRRLAQQIGRTHAHQSLHIPRRQRKAGLGRGLVLRDPQRQVRRLAAYLHRQPQRHRPGRVQGRVGGALTLKVGVAQHQRPIGPDTGERVVVAVGRVGPPLTGDRPTHADPEPRRHDQARFAPQLGLQHQLAVARRDLPGHDHTRPARPTLDPQRRASAVSRPVARCGGWVLTGGVVLRRVARRRPRIAHRPVLPTDRKPLRPHPRPHPRAPIGLKHRPPVGAGVGVGLGPRDTRPPRQTQTRDDPQRTQKMLAHRQILAFVVGFINESLPPRSAPQPANAGPACRKVSTPKQQVAASQQSLDYGFGVSIDVGMW